MALDAAKLAYAGAFVIFSGVIYRYVGGKIVGMLDAYSANVRKQLDDARTLREDAQALVASYKRKQHDAQMEAQDTLERARAAATAMRQDALADLEREIAVREQAALDRIALAGARARQEVQAAAVSTIMKTLETLLTETIQQGDTSALVHHIDAAPPLLQPATQMAAVA